MVIAAREKLHRALGDVPVGISYSGGTSSEWLVRSVLNGTLPRPRHLAVFFADTGEEHEWTYRAVTEVEDACRREGVEFIRCSSGPSLGDHLLAASLDQATRADHPPLWVAKDGGGRGRAMHRCTREFKTAPMRRAQAGWLARIGAPKRLVKWIGFAADEASRAQKALAKADVQWEMLDYPAIRLGITRSTQRLQLERWTGRAPRFSMCTMCPFKSPSRWRDTPARQLDRVYEIDDAIRDMSHVGLTDGDCYLSDRLVPVESLIRQGDPQPSLPGLESYCDGGACFL